MNKELFIDGYLKRISRKFNITKDFAFEVFSIAVVLDMPFDEVYNDVVIKEGDGGIDGAIITQQGEINTLFLFQCKNTISLKQKEIEKFPRDVEEIFSKGKNKINSEGLKKIIDEHNQLTDEGNIIDLKLYFLYQGVNSNSQNGGNKQIFNEFNGKENLEIWDSDRLYKCIDKLIKAQNNRKPIQFTFKPEKSNLTSPDSAQQALYTYYTNNIKAANFRMSALELCKLVDDEVSINTDYDFLFSENIRGWLGFGPRPNKRMKETLEDTETFYEKPEIAKVSIAKVLTAIYDATVGDNKELSQLFNGNKDSRIYQQLFYSYKIYKFVKDRKREDIKKEEFVAHASELVSYGIYRKLENNLQDILSPTEIEKTYKYTLGLIRSVVKDESDKYRKEEREFSFNNYFKNKKCRVDYDKVAKIVENKNVINLLLSER